MTSIVLKASATDTSSGAGSLVTGINLSGEATDVVTATGRLVAVSLIPWPTHILRTGFQSPGIAAIAGGLPYGEFFASVGDVITFGIDWDGALAQYWHPGGIAPPGLVVRPTSPNGFEFATAAGGQFGSVEPEWPSVIGQSVTSGSVTLTAQAISTDSLAATVESVSPNPPAGIAVDAFDIIGQMVVLVIDATEAASGQNYTVLAPTKMTDGETRTGRIVLKVR